MESLRIDDTALAGAGVHVRDLMFYLTTTCGLRCRHCYVGDEWLDRSVSFAGSEALALLAHFGGPGLDRLTFLGGEPLLFPHINDLIRLAASLPIAERRLTTGAQGVGYLDLQGLDPSSLSHISISFEGHTAALHDDVRGPGTYARAWKTLDILRNHGFATHVTYTITGRNIESVLDALALFAARGITHVNFHVVSLIGNAASNNDLAVAPRRWLNLTKELLSRTFVGMCLRIPLMYIEREQYPALIQSGYHPIQMGSYFSGPGGHRLVLYPTGHVYMSCDLTGTPYNFAWYADRRFELVAGRNELTAAFEVPDLSDASAMLLGKVSDGLVPLSISYKIRHGCGD